MNNFQGNKNLSSKKSHTSKSGYVFHEDDTHWQLDKNVKVSVGAVRELLNDDLVAGFINTIVFYAKNYSSAYTDNFSKYFLDMLRVTGTSEITESVLINYRATLNPQREYLLGVVRIFLKRWFDLGYHGVSEDVVELLYDWTLKGTTKGDVIKRLDPINGPLSDIELQGFNEGVVQAYEKNTISITDLSISLVVSSSGRRPIQISHLKIKDVLDCVFW